MDQIRAQSKILVIDDQPFPYKRLFEKDHYTVEKRSDVKQTSDIDKFQYDLILLDLQGVGRSLSNDEGLGVLRYLKEQHPTQLVVAYSNAEFPLATQPFFAMADAVLPKSADYIQFKNEVDRLLQLRFSIGYYMRLAYSEMDPEVFTSRGVERRLRRALRTNRVSELRSLLTDRSSNAVTVDRVLLIVQTGASVLQLLA